MSAPEFGINLRILPGLPENVIYMVGTGGISIADLERRTIKTMTWPEVHELLKEKEDADKA